MTTTALPNRPAGMLREMSGATPVGQAVPAVAATRVQFYWLCALILSFCYELPVIQWSGLDRANPRLFDLVAGFGVLILLFCNQNLRSPFRNPVFKYWAWLVVWFSVCALVWAACWFPWDTAGKFSVYYAFKYLEGLLCVYIVAAVPLTTQQKHRLHWMIVFGGVVVGLYAIGERIQGSTVRMIAEGKELRRAEGTLFSCLGPTYFHLASFSAAATAMTLALANKYPPGLRKYLLYAAAVCAAWPSLFSGSRTGLAMMMLVVAGSFLLMKRTRLTTAFSIGMSIIAILSFFTPEELYQKAINSSASIRRLVGIESGSSGHNSVAARVGFGMQGFAMLTGEKYRWQGYRMPVFGGGFYAVPHSVGGQIYKHRVGYGIHNAYLFPYEQGGLVGFALFVIFLIVTCKYTWKAFRMASNETDKQFAVGALCVLFAFLPAMWVGQIFWQGFGTENFNSMLIVIFALAVRPSTWVASGLPPRNLGAPRMPGPTGMPPPA